MRVEVRVRRVISPTALVMILVFLLTAAGACYVRKLVLEKGMVSAMEARDLDMMKSLAECWPAPVNVLKREEARIQTSGLPLKYDWTTPLHIAAEKGDAELARVLVRRGAKIDAKRGGNQPIHAVAEAAHQASWWMNRWRASASLVPQNPPEKFALTAEVLLDAGAEVDARTEMEYKTPLHFAAAAGDLRFVKLLLARGAKVNALDIYRQTPLDYTLLPGADDKVPILLLRSGADPLIENCDNETALDWAAGDGNPNVLRVMVECGLDPNKTLRNGFTLLDLALNHRDYELFHEVLPGRECRDLLRVLIEKGANVNAPDPDGNIPLCQAVTAEMVRMLVAAGADVNARETDGWTPLHAMISRYEPIWEGWDPSGESRRAMLENWVGAIEALLAAGADVNAETSDGETPMSILIDRLCKAGKAEDAEDADGFRRIREILLKAGAKE